MDLESAKIRKEKHGGVNATAGINDCRVEKDIASTTMEVVH